MAEEILSSVSEASTSDFVYSSLSFFGSQRGGALPGSWFVEALAPLGVSEAAIRQTLYRMEKSGALEARRAGRTKLYAPSAPTRAVLEAGRARILEVGEAEWDGQWTVVHFRFPSGEWQLRDRLREVLMVEGFAALDPGLYLHPRDRIARVSLAAGEAGVEDRLFIVRGHRQPPNDDHRLVSELWDVAGIRARYLAFLARFAAIDANQLSELEAFAVRFAAVFQFFRITWDDPDLPPELLSGDWPGARARARAAELYATLDRPALRFADRVLEQVGHASSQPAMARP